MSACDRFRANAAGLVTLPPGDPDREAAWAHARECPDCTRALRAAEHFQAMLAASDPRASVDGGALTATSDEIVTELRRENRRRMRVSGIAVIAAFALAVGLARHRSPAQTDRVLAFVLAFAALASAVGAVARDWAVLIAIGVPAASVALAVVAGRGGGLQPDVGVECLATELACAGTVIAGAWIALRGGSTSLGPRTAAAGAAAGALAGMAALELTCPAHGAFSHLVLFHAAGVLLAAATAAVIWRFTPAPSTTHGPLG